MDKRLVKILNISFLSSALMFGAVTLPVSAKMSSLAHQYYEAACRAESAHNYMQAIEQMKLAIEQTSDDALLYTKLAGFYTEIGDWKNAL